MTAAYPVRIFFAKTGRAKYISALDLINCIQRALRRTDLPVWHTQGFNPHTYVNVNLPLSLGIEGLCETMDIKLDEPLPYDIVAEKLDAALPDDIHIIRAAAPIKKHTEIDRSVYEISNFPDAKAFISFLSLDKIIAEKKTKKSVIELDLKPYISISEINSDGFTLILPSGCDFTVNPSLVFDAYEKYTGSALDFPTVKRVRILCKDGTDFE